MREIDEYIGMMIRERRQQVGYKQIALAAAVGVTQRTMTNIERGRWSISAALLLKIARELDAPVSFFLPEREPVSVEHRHRISQMVRLAARLRNASRKQRQLIHDLLGEMGVH